MLLALSLSLSLSLSLGLCHNHTLLTLEVGSNQLTDSSAKYFSEALRINKKLEGLSLWQNDITSEVQIECTFELKTFLLHYMM